MKTIITSIIAASMVLLSSCRGGETVPEASLAGDLLNLPEAHDVEESLFGLEDAVVSQQDSAALRLANRFVQMYQFVTADEGATDGRAKDVLQWAIAVNGAVDAFCQEVASVPRESALEEISRVFEKFSSQTQREMNYSCYLDAVVDYFYTIEAYRQWLTAVPENLKPLAQEEYEAWYDLNEARFNLWNDVSNVQTWYSMKPMEINGYYLSLSANRRAELEIERGIVLEGQAYSQKGKTVTTQEWEDWIVRNSAPEDIDDLMEFEDFEHIPSEELVTERVEAMRTSFSRWLAARQAFAAALPTSQGQSYDNLTADIHSRIIGTLEPLIPFTY